MIGHMSRGPNIKDLETTKVACEARRDGVEAAFWTLLSRLESSG